MEIRGRDSEAPALALRAVGVRGAECREERAMASTERKWAVRRMAPRLPGSSCGGLVGWREGSGREGGREMKGASGEGKENLQCHQALARKGIAEMQFYT